MNSDSNQEARPRMIHAVKTMPRWKWKLLGIGLSIGCIGAAGQAASHFLVAPAPVQQTAPASPSTVTTPPPSSPTLTDALAPFMSKFGFSLFIGIVVGLIFRTFIRLALTMSVITIGCAMAVSYLFHINIDMTVVKADTSQAVNWMTDQGYRLKDMMFHVLPSSTAASLGFLFGFKRR
jgi:uncharacterized membrane protein (Fun14 family)